MEGNQTSRCWQLGGDLTKLTIILWTKWISAFHCKTQNWGFHLDGSHVFSALKRTFSLPSEKNSEDFGHRQVQRHTPLIPRKLKQVDSKLEPSMGNLARSYFKIKFWKDCRCSYVIKNLLRMCEALDFICSTSKRKRKEFDHSRFSSVHLHIQWSWGWSSREDPFISISVGSNPRGVPHIELSFPFSLPPTLAVIAPGLWHALVNQSQPWSSFSVWLKETWTTFPIPWASAKSKRCTGTSLVPRMGTME